MKRSALPSDGKAVVYPASDQDTDNLWLQPLDGSPGKQLTNFKSEHILDFHWSFDGSKVGMIRGHTDSDVVLLQESKPWDVCQRPACFRKAPPQDPISERS